MRVNVIGNPVAGRGRAASELRLLGAGLRAAGHDVTTMLTAAAGDARRFAGQIRGDTERLVVVGGDGTINEVLNGLADPAATPMVILPMGTANVLAREFRLPWHAPGTVELVGRGRVLTLDLATARPLTSPTATAGELAITPSRRFLALASAGFDSMVTGQLSRTRKGSLGFVGYARPVCAVIRRYNAPKLRITIDDQPPIEGAMVVASQIRNYGGWFCVADQARPGSGMLHVVVLRRGGVLAMAGYAVSALRGRISRRRDVTYLTGRKVRIEADTAVPVEVDGDHWAWAPVEIAITPAGARLVVPA